MYEIERKFLLDELPAATADVEPTRIDQGYLAVTDDLEVRVRARSGDHVLTVKGGRGEVRTEVTLQMSPEQFHGLWALTAGRRISKRRWVLSHEPEAKVEVEVDRFEAELEGLLIAEVEFASEEASQAFRPPDWFGREVTNDDRYRNAALATQPPPP
ncbi:MAG TPA: CYTH domain-containing protein [Euzebyales bacterium]|nr:CYTH domain-containing protein [Euzebyales bacterium]